MNEPTYAFLALFKLKWLLFATMLIIDEKWLDELDELVDGAGRLNNFVVFHYCLANSESDGTFVLKLHVVHQCRIMVHAEDCNRQSVKWDRQKFHQ